MNLFYNYHYGVQCITSEANMLFFNLATNDQVKEEKKREKGVILH